MPRRMRIRRNPLWTGLLTLLVLAAGAPSPGQERRLLDEVLAMVDEQPILASDVERTIGLGLMERRPDESEEAFRDRVLEALIDQQLRFQEVDRYGFTELPVEQVEAQVQAMRDRFASPQEWRRRLTELGLDEQGVRRLVARQLLLMTWVEERLGPRVFISLDDVRSYYTDTLVPELRARGEPVPPIEEVREQIRGLLREQRLNAEIASWTEELRLEADVEVFDAGAHAELPAKRGEQ